MKFISMDYTSSVPKLHFFCLFNFSEIRVHLVIDVSQAAIMIELSFAVFKCVLADCQNQTLQIRCQQRRGELEVILEHCFKPLKSNDSEEEGREEVNHTCYGDFLEARAKSRLAFCS